ncbi:MAG: hypothetical protein KBD03_03645 [Gammaproteobacteria bacterium]|nr:hypothetical protein [Gammaproteobacteria bacterium]
MLNYNGSLSTNAQFIAEVNEYNKAFSIFTKQQTRTAIKIKVADNVVHRLMAINKRLREEDENWLNKSEKANSSKSTNYHALLNRRILLANFEEIKRILEEIGASQDLLEITNKNIKLQKDIIINRENDINRSFGNRALEIIEVAAFAGLLIGGLAMGVGGTGMLLRYAGFFASQACVTTTAATAATTEGTILFGGSVVGGTSLVAMRVVSVAKEKEPEGIQAVATPANAPNHG